MRNETPPLRTLVNEFKARVPKITAVRCVHPTSIALVMTRAYYDELNKDPKFIAELGALFSTWSHKALGAFAKRWPLPPEGLKDLYLSYDRFNRGFMATPRLEAVVRSYPGATNPREAAKLGYRQYPRRLNAAAIESGARRLYERVVRKRSWQDIAQDTRGAERYVDTKLVRKQVQHWARALGIQLPERAERKQRQARSAEKSRVNL